MAALEISEQIFTCVKIERTADHGDVEENEEKDMVAKSHRVPIALAVYKMTFSTMSIDVLFLLLPGFGLYNAVMKRHQKNTWVLLFLFCTISLACFAISPAAKFLQGTWHRGGELTDGGHPFAWYIDITLNGSRYEKKGYPPYYATGTYKIIKEEGATLTLLFKPEKGGNDQSEPYEAVWILDFANDTVTVGPDVMTRQK